MPPKRHVTNPSRCAAAMLLAGCLLVSCRRESKLEGDVFVVTKGGQNVKLGLVEVRFVPDSSVTASVGPVMETAKARAREFKKALDHAAVDRAIAAIGSSARPEVARVSAETLEYAEMIAERVPTAKNKKKYEDAKLSHLKCLEDTKEALEREGQAIVKVRSLARELELVLIGVTGRRTPSGGRSPGPRSSSA